MCSVPFHLLIAATQDVYDLTNCPVSCSTKVVFFNLAAYTCIVCFCSAVVSRGNHAVLHSWFFPIFSQKTASSVFAFKAFAGACFLLWTTHEIKKEATELKTKTSIISQILSLLPSGNGEILEVACCLSLELTLVLVECRFAGISGNIPARQLQNCPKVRRSVQQDKGRSFLASLTKNGKMFVFFAFQHTSAWCLFFAKNRILS